MIAKLSGFLESVSSDSLIIDVNGVGYQVFASTRTLSRVGQKGDAVSLLIDTHVREDHIHLYGFADHAEQEWCRLLTSVQGVGMKVGLAILGACAPDQLGFAIAAQDVTVLRQADGVGPKLATRIVTELKDKAGKIDLSMITTAKNVVSKLSATTIPDIAGEALSALVNLGYGRTEAYSVIVQIQKLDNNARLPDLIRLALKQLSY